MKLLLPLLLSFPFIGVNAGNNPFIDIKHYRFELSLNDSTDVIGGKATIMLVFTKPADHIELDLKQKLQDGKGMLVNSVFARDSEVSFTQTENKLVIRFGETVKASEERTLTVSYSGIPGDGLIISKNKFGDRTFFGDNWPDRAHHWLPVVDHPSDKASVEFIVTAPLHYAVIANGVKMEESVLNKNIKLTHWREEVPVSTKVMVIGAARFAIQYAGEAANVPVESWVFPENRLEGFHDFASASQILDFFHTHIGNYPYKKLANVQSKTRYGGMENASNIFYFENFVNGKADHDDLIAHEIAHQWFGNSATEADWHHVWLSEGFATYFTQLYNEYTYGKERRAENMGLQRKDVIEYAKRDPSPVVLSKLPTRLTDILNVNSYQKGGWVLHMLRIKLGDDAFWRGIRHYYKKYRNSTASTADLQKIMEESSGQDLDQFFRQWLYTPGHPVVEVSWTYHTGRKAIEVTVSQIQSGVLFNFPLEIGISAGGSPRVIETIQISAKTQKFIIRSELKPDKILADPMINLLFEAKVKN